MHYYTSKDASQIAAFRKTLLTMDGSHLPNGLTYELVSSPAGSTHTIRDKTDGVDCATVQLMPNGTMRFTARADCFEMLPMQDTIHDWNVVNPGPSQSDGKCFLQSKNEAGLSMEVKNDAIIGFTTGVVNLNPIDGKGKPYPLHNSGKQPKPPPQQPKGKGSEKGEPSSPGGGGEKKEEGEEKAGEAKEGEEKKDKGETVDGDILAETQSGGSEGEGQDGGDTEDPPPTESDQPPPQQEQQQGQGEGKPPPPDLPFVVGQRVWLGVTETAKDSATGKPTLHTNGQLPVIVLDNSGAQPLFQLIHSGRYLYGNAEKFKITAFGTVPVTEDRTAGSPNEPNVRCCPKGFRYLAVGELISPSTYIRYPLGGHSPVEIECNKETWHPMNLDQESIQNMEKRNKKPAMVYHNENHMGIFPFSYYITPVVPVEIKTEKEYIDVGFCKLIVEEWVPKPPERVAETVGGGT